MKNILFGLCVMVVFSAMVRGGEQESSKLPPLPQAVSSLGATACDGYVYIYGGHLGQAHFYDKNTVLDTFHRCKIDGGKEWEKLSGSQNLQGMNIASYGGKIYLVGGMQPRNEVGAKADLHSVTDCLCYDPTKKSWDKIAALPVARSSHELLVAGNKLVVIGGWQMRGQNEKSVWCDTTLTLDLTRPDSKWESIPQPFKRRALTGTAIGNKVYVIGGLNDSAGSEKRVDILDLSTSKWSQGPEMPGEEKVGFSPAACTLNDRVILNTSEGPVYRLSEKGDAWEKVGQVKHTRIVHRIVPAGKDAVVVLGGAGSDGNVGEVEVVSIPAK